MKGDKWWFGIVDESRLIQTAQKHVNAARTSCDLSLFVLKPKRESMNKILFFSILLFSHSLFGYYRTKWDGPLSDYTVQKAGYTFYICTKKCKTIPCTCSAVYIKPQQLYDAILILKPYKNETLDDAIQFLRMESTDTPYLAIKILRDFKNFARYAQFKKFLQYSVIAKNVFNLSLKKPANITNSLLTHKRTCDTASL